MGRARVLIADDHRIVCESVAELLQSDFDVEGLFSNGQELLSAAQRLQPDVVVSDISMPVLDGIEAATQLRASGSTAKIVFLTVHDRSEFVRACLAAGAQGYVLKSYLAADLIPAIHAVLAGQRFISPALNFPGESKQKKASA